jgi:serine/threonine protein kinase
VYSAVSDTGAKVAIKHVILDSEDARRYFVREREAVRALSHPACVAFIESRDFGSEAMLVTKFEPGGTLDAAIKQEFAGRAVEGWSTTKSINVFGIAFGMEIIHKQGLAHRDLKSANVFLNENFEPVIGDFGLSTNFEMEEKVEPSMAIGTPLHMAPELWLDESKGYNQAVDVYAYGVLLYTLFAADPCANLDDGKNRARNISDLMTRIGRGARFKRLETINEDYWKVMTNSWNHAPEKRPTFVDIVDGLIGNVPGFLFPGANEAQVRRYIELMMRFR